MRKRYIGMAGTIGVAILLAGAPAAHAQKFTDMNREVEGFLTGLWARTSAPADRPPNEAEVAEGIGRCDQPMIDPKMEAAASLRSIFPSDGASRGDISMFRTDGGFVLVERMQMPSGTSYPFPRKMTVSAVQQQNRIIVRFVSRGVWADGTWNDSPGPPALWGDAMLGDLDVGGNTEHVFVLGKDNSQITYVKCGS